ncbi:MAG: membrane protein insertion efficiency factor YidD [Acidobacteriota bacterium]|jgi:putative component of membrane protein insertase Oxa1/YidC/SpoIIIJ protein YidD|nr:membrane protein insertion efficiency factor YidD [Acidobacteriota bacterium]
MKFGVILVRTYQRVWHPLYQGCADRGVVLVRCALQPTCSEFALRAFARFSFFRALRLVWARLLRCHRAGKVREGK